MSCFANIYIYIHKLRYYVYCILFMVYFIFRHARWCEINKLRILVVIFWFPGFSGNRWCRAASGQGPWFGWWSWWWRRWWWICEKAPFLHDFTFHLSNQLYIWNGHAFCLMYFLILGWYTGSMEVGHFGD